MSESTPQFTVSWGPANQDPNGSGVATYSVYVSDNGGPFTPLVTDTSGTSATFTGQKGHRYSFYSLATDDAGNTQSPASAVTVTTTVGDIVATIQAATVSPTENTKFSGAVATFTGSDPNGSSADFTAQIDWGDGSTLDTGVISGSAAAGYTISGSHTYAEEATKVPLKVIVTDEVGDKTTILNTMNVADASLSVTLSSVAPTEGTAFSGTVATFSDANPLATTADFTATITWGDGSSSAGTVAVDAAGGFIVTGSHTYAEEAVNATLVVVVNDVGGANATAGGSINVADASLSATFSTIAPTEGTTFSGTVATFSDANSLATTADFTATITWGDGSSSAGTIAVNPAGGFEVTGEHVYAEEAQNLTVSVAVSDVGGAGASASGTVDVADASLSGTAVAISATEGFLFSGAVATFSDANPNGTTADFTAMILWGDGSSSAGTVAVNAAGSFQVSGSQVYAAAAQNLTVKTVVSDKGGALITIVGTSDVADASLSANAGAAISTTAGAVFNGTLATFTDANPLATAASFAATIAWGDGSSSAGTLAVNPTGEFEVTGSHVYKQPAKNLEVTVSIDDVGGATASVTDTATIAVAPISVTATAIQATEGGTLHAAVATFTDANPLLTTADFTATIAWGDGSSSAGTVAANPAGGFEVTGSHVYADEAQNLTLSVIVNQGSAGAASATAAATVGDASLTATAATVQVRPGAPLVSATVATFTDANPLATAADFTATIVWGDGSSSAGTVVETAGTFSVQGSHTYSDTTNNAIAVSVFDKGGATAQVNSSGEVGDVNAQFVASAYLDVLGRPVDAGGLAYWDKQLDAGQSRTVVTNLIDHSPEYFANIIIQPDYLKYLGRQADPGGLAYWIDQMQNHGLTDEELEASFIASPEFYTNAGKQHPGVSADEAWVDALYQSFLGRLPDPQGLKYWLGQLSTGESRDQVALGFATSPERETQRITEDYFHYLGRGPDPQGLDFWVSQFANGVTNEDLITDFVASQEYFQKHTRP